jgi:predicted dehydrogenase
MVHRIGIIGLGIMGRRMLGNLQSHAGFAVAAAWDAAPAAMDWVRTAHPEIAPAPSAEALAARDDLAAVYIASPPVSHPAYVNLAWDHGKAAFCEKPLAVDLAASQALVERCAAEQRRAAINFPLASAPAVRRMAEAAASGALGALRSIDIEVDFAAWPREWQKAGDWLAERLEGGFVREVVSHFIFATQRLTGPLTILEAHPTFPADGRHAETAIEARLAAGGVAVTLRGSVGATELPDSNSFTLVGSAGACRLYDWYKLQQRSDGDWVEIDLGGAASIRQRSYRAQLDALAAMLDGKPHDLPTLAEGLAVQSCVEELLRGK